MDREIIHDTRRIRAVWALLLCLVIALTIGADIAFARHGRELRENDPITHFKTGLDYLHEGRLPEALDEAARAIELNPKYGDAYVLRANIQSRLGQWTEAAASYTRGFELGESSGKAAVNAVCCHIRAEDFAAAVEMGKKAEARGVTRPDLYQSMAVACVRQGQQIDAIPYLEKALDGMPTDLYLLDQLTQAYAAAGREEDAEAVRERMEQTRLDLGNAVAGPTE